MIRTGELPAGDTCLRCGLPTKDACDLVVHCERQWYKAASFNWLALSLSFPHWLLAMARRGTGDVFGRETVIRVSLRVREEHHQWLATRSQRKLRKLLRTVPVYAQLLDEYPESRIYPLKRKNR
jgi:hypothetical protein